MKWGMNLKIRETTCLGKARQDRSRGLHFRVFWYHQSALCDPDPHHPCLLQVEDIAAAEVAALPVRPRRGCRPAGCPEHRGALHTDDPEYLPLRRQRRDERHPGYSKVCGREDAQAWICAHTFPGKVSCSGERELVRNGHISVWAWNFSIPAHLCNMSGITIVHVPTSESPKMLYTHKQR